MRRMNAIIRAFDIKVGCPDVFMGAFLQDSPHNPSHIPPKRRAHCGRLRLESSPHLERAFASQAKACRSDTRSLVLGIRRHILRRRKT
ncbi:hypothetical protein HMPREF0762_01851 [Slackia exigua ATCC 700122]|uniref:Uncharacterized protein n=1 Tax=Slackia exigua (strain ATCC 700122 / DSM 15923 / CIP 105133 / JCM 11022 / KCTC 5966 / S-7) TaxID=649764 RepID=D0WJ26_SLAES|nr:hypothetical protein HMPREF0762_01851 [Slackia exigua ATCC 700122]